MAAPQRRSTGCTGRLAAAVLAVVLAGVGGEAGEER